MKNNELREMGLSLSVVFLIVFFSVFPLSGLYPALNLALFYTFLFFVPFLPLVFTFKELDIVEKIVIANILGIGYVGIYATLDVFLKIKLEMATYLIVTLLIFSGCFFYYYRKKE